MKEVDVFMRDVHPMSSDDDFRGDSDEKSFLREIQICEADLDVMKGSKVRGEPRQRRRCKQ